MTTDVNNVTSLRNSTVGGTPTKTPVPMPTDLREPVRGANGDSRRAIQALARGIRPMHLCLWNHFPTVRTLGSAIILHRTGVREQRYGKEQAAKVLACTALMHGPIGSTVDDECGGADGDGKGLADVAPRDRVQVLPPGIPPLKEAFIFQPPN
jgi:hypothetical protein